ncbi:glycosyltransferase [Thioalkalivibrio sp.]|uniref:glycosyltransferase n=1 Tax=Thioalkalivibrio sp. TaxID=2093813 RepID=UPI003975A114
MTQLPPPGISVDTRDLRVAFLSDSLPERNGTGAYYQDLVTHLRHHLDAVCILQPRARRGFDPLSMPMPGDATQRLVIPDVRRIRRTLDELDPHLIISVTPGPFGLLGPRTARRMNIPFVTAYHTHFAGLAALYWGPLRRRLANAPLQAANRYLCRRSATVLVNNSELQSAVRALGARTCEVMGTPLDAGFLTAAPSPPRRIETVCFAGRLAAEKNIDAVLNAVHDWPDLGFVIAGDGPLRREVEAAAARCPNLRYVGWLERRDLRQVIDGASLLVLPSHAETFGSVALEAMARARPVLVSAAAGIHDWPELAPGLFRLGTEETLSTALRRLRGYPSDAVAAAGAAARQAAEAFHRGTLAQWLEMLQRHVHRLQD